MKHSLSVFIAMICSLQFAWAQPYKPLVDDFNEWHFTTCFSGCNTVVYYTDGDTLVSGISYKILDGYHYISRTFLLREDVPGRKVYLTTINPTKTEQFLLYDFSKSEGDTMELVNPVSPFVAHAGFFKLDSIRLQPLEDGDSYRHFYWSPTPSNVNSQAHPVWVEGVGSLSLINAAAGQPDFNGAGQLNCFFKNSDPFYVNLDSIVSCEPVHVLGTKEPALTNGAVYPNPLHRELNLKGQFPGQQYHILNLQGVEMLTGTIDNSGMIQVESLSNGHYFLRVGEQKIPFIKH